MFVVAHVTQDGNGQITLAELKDVLGTDSPEDSPELHKILQDVDTDGDGQISYLEFKDMMLKLFK